MRMWMPVLVLFISCSDHTKPIIITAENYHKSVDKVTEIMIHDIFSPPVASRIYAYPNIAAYEILAQKDSTLSSISGQLNGLTKIPKPGKDEEINDRLSSLVAHFELSKRLIFSENKMQEFIDSVYTSWEQINKEEYLVSKAYGLKVVEHIDKWSGTDNYAQTRTMPKYSVDYDAPERWQPTPPAYMDGIEPHWNKIRPFFLESADEFKPIAPPDFSLDKESVFYKELQEVYDISTEMSKEGDESEKIKIAQFWDCNPYVSVTRGHLMFATKKITPGAHWVGITKIALRKENADFNQTVFAYTKVSIAIADAFISCWDEKYRSNLVRPETLINRHIDEQWKPILQTPPFPEYVSGHSVVSGASAEVLTNIFGDNFSFNDNTEIPYGLPIRQFSSFKEAAQEAAMSRLYGGIHYRAAVEVGLNQGIQIGKKMNNKLVMKRSK
nr:vanadium-dependent haloperoxidase [Aquimarina sediminis]